MRWASRRSTRRYSTPVRFRSARVGCGSRPDLPSPTGELTRVMIVDEARGWVLEQHLYDGRRTPIATAWPAVTCAIRSPARTCRGA